MSKILNPYITPKYLNESGFVAMGFFTGVATNFQIQAAATMAEWQVATSVRAFLIPTTGTLIQEPFLGFQQYELPFGKIRNINYVTFHEKFSDGGERLISGSAIILDEYFGYYSPYISQYDNASYTCRGHSLGIDYFEVNFDSGYMTGVSNSPILQPNVLWASYAAMDIFLKAMYDEGIFTYFENQVKTLQVGRMIQTFETKGFLGNTAFGPSARGQMIYNLLEPIRISSAGRLSGRTRR